jgi:hypothetical protein
MSDKVNFWIKDATERVLSTAGQVVLAAVSLWLFVQETGLLEVDWQTVAVGGPLVVLFTVLKVLAASGLGDKGTAAVDRDPVRLVDAEFHADDYKE